MCDLAEWSVKKSETPVKQSSHHSVQYTSKCMPSAMPITLKQHWVVVSTDSSLPQYIMCYY